MLPILAAESKGTTCEAEVEKAEKMLLKDAKIRLYESNSHYEDFLSCVKSRKKPVASEQIGGRTVICCHLMNQLYFNNTPMKWDPAKFLFYRRNRKPCLAYKHLQGLD